MRGNRATSIMPMPRRWLLILFTVAFSSPDRCATSELEMYCGRLLAFLTDPSIVYVNQMLRDSLQAIIVSNPRTHKWQLLASAQTGSHYNEHYATTFGRDLTITLYGLADAVDHGALDLEGELQKGMTALEELESYQAVLDDPTKGIKRGAIPHEIRFSSDPRYEWFKEHNWPVFTTINACGQVVDEKTISYDSSEATHLYVVLVMRLEQLYPGFASQRRTTLRRACEYILTNSQEHNGLAGFVNDLPKAALEDDAEAYGGLTRLRTLPDSARRVNGLAYRERDENNHVFLNGLKPKPGEPIHGFWTTAIKFAAEMEAADYYENMEDLDFASRLRNDAKITKQKANSRTEGFLRDDPLGQAFYVEAIAVNPEMDKREQLPYVTSSALFALAFTYTKKNGDGQLVRDRNGKVTRESIIDDAYLGGVVCRLENELFDEKFGLKTYSPNQLIPAPQGGKLDGYWISPGRTSWGVENYLAASGMIDLGYHKSALRIGVTANRVLEKLGSAVELWVKDENDQIALWTLSGKKSETIRQSCKIQGFTVGPGLAFNTKAVEMINESGLF